MKEIKALSALALAFLDAQRLPPSPSNYRLAFAFHDGEHAELVKAVSAIIDDGIRITQAETDTLHERFLGAVTTESAKRADEARTAAIRHQALGLAELAASATATTGEFGRELERSIPELADGTSASMQELFARTLERTQRAERELAATTAQVEQLREKLEAVQGDAERDALTGLPNRRGIDAYLAADARREAPHVFAICDIDRFKSYNDRYGHAVGDRVLKTVAASLQETLTDHFVGRWGGEEFIVVARTDVTDGVKLVEAAKTALGERHFKLRETDEPMGRISFSAGVVVLPLETGAHEGAFAAADALLYKAKEAGRDRVLGG